MLSLLLAQRIVLGGPALATWEKRLLILAYGLLVACLVWGVGELSLTLVLPNTLSLACEVLFVLLVPLFGILFWRGKRVVVTRRGHLGTLRRGIALLFSALATGLLLVWCAAEAVTGHPIWVVHGPGVGVLVSICLAGCAALLVKILLA